jgi:hypothetical protein
MTAQRLAAREGRPSIAGLQESLLLAREVNVNLALELRAERVEHKAFAQRVRQRIDRVKNLIAIGSDMAAINEAGKIGYDSDRRLEQLGSVVL